MEFKGIVLKIKPFIAKENIYKTSSIIVVIIFGVVGYSKYSINDSDGSRDIVREASAHPMNPLSKSKIKVYISGAIQSPGMYEVDPGKRVHELIALAGDLTSNYDKTKFEKSVNLAKKLTDGQQVYIPMLAGVENPKMSSSQEDIDEESDSLVNPQSDASDGNDLMINLNSASRNELISLPGIGEVTADKIIKGRPFKSKEDVLIRKIVSNSTYQKIVGKVKV